MSSITQSNGVAPRQTIAYSVKDQVLLIFTAADGNPVFPANTGGPPLERTALDQLLAGQSMAFSDDAASQYVVALSSKQRSATALAQVTLSAGRVEDCVTALSNRLSGQKVKRFAITNYGRTLWLTHVAPNWLSGGAPEPIGTGGPGAPPTRVSGASGPAPLTIPGLAACARKDVKGGQDVHVFILDTLPGPRPSSGSREVALPSRVKSGLRSHPLGKAWVEATESEETSGRPTGEVMDCNTDLTREWADPRALAVLAAAGYRIEGHTYDMSDHGLFVAGIVKQIAPNAKIHVIEVLNEFGVGSASMIAAGFAYVRRFMAACPQAICIVNCSFTLAIPVLKPQALHRRKRAASPHNAHGLPAALRRLLGDPVWTGSFLEAIIGLKTVGSRVVAAAGNESNATRRIIRAARYPARLPTVLGVGALDKSGDRAWYSNYPDSPEEAGLMTLGTVRSLFTGRFPLNPSIPTYSRVAGNGFADWSGTSFAAPIISGALAQLVSVHGHSLRSAEKCLRRVEATTDSETGGEVVTARQGA